MKYRVTGCDAQTGEDRTLTVDADSEKEAIAAANAQGVFPSSMKQLASPKDSAVNLGKAKKDSNLDLGCLFGVGFLLVLGITTCLFPVHVFSSAIVLFMIFSVTVTVVVVVMVIGVALKKSPEEGRRATGTQWRIICPHCQKRGCVTAHPVRRSKGISGSKATGALLTGGLSILVTGLSSKEDATKANCSNCGSEWYF